MWHDALFVGVQGVLHPLQLLRPGHPAEHIEYLLLQAGGRVELTVGGSRERQRLDFVLTDVGDRFGQRDKRWYLWVPALGLLVSPPILVAFLLFIGAMGKSAQLLLHTWLPDAMEGPTPVSALIHAATMVTAGVFLVCRMSPVIEYAPMAGNFIIIVGAVTAFFAATVGLVQKGGQAGRNDRPATGSRSVLAPGFDFGCKGRNGLLERHDLLLFGAESAHGNSAIFDFALADCKQCGHLGHAVFANLVRDFFVPEIRVHSQARSPQFGNDLVCILVRI